MNKIIFVFVIVSSLLGSNRLHAQSESFIDISSVDAFFRTADIIASGSEPTDSQWKELFETKGFKKCIEETFEERTIFIRAAMDLAYNPTKVSLKDSVMRIPVTEILSDMESLLMRVILENYLDIKTNQAAIKEQLQTMNYDQLAFKAGERLKNFLVNPVDSLILPIPVSLVCIEPDALSLTDMVVWDYNLFYKQSEEERVNILAHEMFHAYRRHFVNGSNVPHLIQLIDAWHNEGIADLIDKNSVSDLSSAFIRFGLPESYVEGYNEVYETTPQMLKKLEAVTLSFMRNEINEDDFAFKLSEFIQYGGHPNGFYMAMLIKNAGFEKDLVRTFDSPVEFMKLYNQSVDREYALGNEFMDYIKSLTE